MSSAIKRRFKFPSRANLSQLAEIIKNENIQNVLRVLAEGERGFGDLHEALGGSISDSNLAKVLQKCIQIGLVVRDPLSGRGKNVRYIITEDGERALTATERIKKNPEIYTFLKDKMTTQEFEIGIPILSALRQKWNYEKKKMEKDELKLPITLKGNLPTPREERFPLGPRYEFQLGGQAIEPETGILPSWDGKPFAADWGDEEREKRERVNHRWLREAVLKVAGPSNFDQVKRILEDSPPSYYNAFQKLIDEGLITLRGKKPSLVDPELAEETITLRGVTSGPEAERVENRLKKVDSLLDSLKEYLGSPYDETLVKKLGKETLQKIDEITKQANSKLSGKKEFKKWFLLSRFDGTPITGTTESSEKSEGSEKLGNISALLFELCSEIGRIACSEPLKTIRVSLIGEKIEESYLLEIHPTLEGTYLLTLLHEYPYDIPPQEFQKSRVEIPHPNIELWQQENLWTQVVQEIGKITKFLDFTPQFYLIVIKCQEHAVISLLTKPPIILITGNHMFKQHSGDLNFCGGLALACLRIPSHLHFSTQKC